ncbi:EEF1A lysine methyltransferase 1 [Microplitis mediator]|uniref:EEF1A lysine methyltransferase 1 n=1 Tax=Microplitis mediator TaxID=375433 RepID=UPI0025575925|nr:EEF1A lysine methyltransferase 1 [Microplitis mediator]
MTDSDDEIPQLSESTMAALQEFYAERQQREEQISKTIIDGDNETSDNNVFDEDWQLSQFWYDDETVNTITTAALSITNNDGKIALISCPTLYRALKKDAGNRTIKIFEYDQRFSVYGSDFIPYDYNFPLHVPEEMSSDFDLVIADPPFLSEECLTKTTETIKFLSKKNIVLCTGALMADLAEKLLNVKKCDFQPHHKNNLANEFSCFANFDFDALIK